MMQLTASNFEEKTSDGIVVVDFYADWCGPCKALGPVLDSLAETFDGKVTIAKVDIDTESELAIQFSVQSIPTLIFFKDGKQEKTMLGAHSEGALEKEINDLL